MDLDDLELAPRIKTLLRRDGVTSVDALTDLNPRELLAMDGLGAKALALIELALAAIERSLSDDPYAPYLCAREGELRGDAALAGVFLCDACASIWQTEAFADIAPTYVGESVNGYCLNCNELKSDVHLRQWFLCGNCERVARSIGRSVVAARSVVSFWETEIAPNVPELELRDIDTPRLSRRTRDVIEAKVPSIDFIVVDRRTGTPAFGLELKTGKGRIGRHGIGSRIAEFQLDTSDCDDILAVVEREQIPVYVVHAQVIDRAEPPTVRYAALGLWWTDLFSMAQGFLRVQKRPRETRMAAYYDTSIFRDFATFAGYITNLGVAIDAERLQSDGWRPSAYQLPK